MATSLDISKIVFPDVMDLRTAAIFLQVSEMRVRALAHTGTLKSSKDGDNRWAFKKVDLAEFVANPPVKTRKAGAPKGDGKAWIIRVKFADMEKVKGFLTPLGIKIEPRYDYAKMTEYRLKRDAAKKAGKAAATPAVPAKPGLFSNKS